MCGKISTVSVEWPSVPVWISEISRCNYSVLRYLCCFIVTPPCPCPPPLPPPHFTNQHRCCLWLSTAGGVRANAGGKIASTSSQLSMFFTGGEIHSFISHVSRQTCISCHCVSSEQSKIWFNTKLYSLYCKCFRAVFYDPDTLYRKYLGLD